MAQRQDSEPIVETGGELVQPERGSPGGGQLNRERDSIEASTDRARDRRASRVRREASFHRPRPGDEEADGGRLEQLLAILRVLGRHLERGNPIHVLSRRAQRLAAGRHHAHVRGGTQHRFCHACCRLDDVFAIVQHKQQALGTERGRHPLGGLRAVRESKLERKIDTFRGESAFGSWFYRIVSNAAYGRRRPQASVEIPLEEVLPAFDEHGRHASLLRDWSSSVDDPAVQKQLRDLLTSAIDELPPHYRAAIVLRDVEGLSTAEVADALGIPVLTAKTRAHRARLLLRERLSTFMEIERPSETEVPTRPS